MFNSFKRKPPQISIFHHPSSPPSKKALDLLMRAKTSPYPPTEPTASPLEYELDIVEGPPTADQLRTILSYMPSKATSPSMALLSAHPSASEASGKGVKEIAELASRNPKALKWPVVVDWDDGKAAVGSVDGVKEILEALRRKRDEGEKEEDTKPKGWFT
ncbi:hypothetical protein D9611_000572 [Ephemerocybe angulata]|uniref:Thioredoxin-like protein n=1 Tax=Ephemerocybe angulata TaxID=980116 RepID=A0A8H5F7I7_9AGAR|nr:hypothetical protein D9611_000572 [Tulosesus angulatus]